MSIVRFVKEAAARLVGSSNTRQRKARTQERAKQARPPGFRGRLGLCQSAAAFSSMAIGSAAVPILVGLAPVSLAYQNMGSDDDVIGSQSQQSGPPSPDLPPRVAEFGAIKASSDDSDDGIPTAPAASCVNLTGLDIAV